MEMMTVADLTRVCRHLEDYGRMYWERSWAMGEPEWVVKYSQNMASKYYEAARDVRDEVIRRICREALSWDH